MFNFLVFFSFQICGNQEAIKQVILSKHHRSIHLSSFDRYNNKWQKQKAFIPIFKSRGDSLIINNYLSQSGAISGAQVPVLCISQHRYSR